MTFCSKDFFCKCDQIWSFQENFIFTQFMKMCWQDHNTFILMNLLINLTDSVEKKST